jgi:uroporphyrinogen III methyltransferase / synthase
MSSRSGKVYLVGAGPGDPGLLTLKAAEVLRRAQVVLYDALVSDAVVALASESCERIFVGKRGSAHAMEQRGIERLMIDRARAGKTVVRLKGGDPFVFGRGGEEAQALHDAGISFEIVPGVSSALAVPAYAGIPVTDRRCAAAFTVLTGHEDPTKSGSTLDWTKLADPNRTLVILMGTGTLPDVARHLIEHGLAGTMPAAVIANGTLPSQQTVTGTLLTIADAARYAKIESPAIVVIGEVVRLRDRLQWFDTEPLFGKRVMITRAGHQSESFAAALLSRGAEPILAPTIAIEEIGDPSADGALKDLSPFAWIVFTSQNGVDAFFRRIESHNADARALCDARVAAIGPRTAERLESYGVRADLVPDEFVSETIARDVIAASSPGDRVLLYRAAEARDALPRLLEEAGRVVDDVAAYRTTIPSDPAFAEKVARADVLTFTSASTVRGFSTLLGGDTAAATAAQGKCVACIGPITAQAVKETGLTPDVVAAVYTTAGLLDALEAYFSTQA